MNSRKAFNKIEKNSRFFLRISQISAVLLIMVGASCDENKTQQKKDHGLIWRKL